MEKHIPFRLSLVVAALGGAMVACKNPSNEIVVGNTGVAEKDISGKVNYNVPVKEPCTIKTDAGVEIKELDYLRGVGTGNPFIVRVESEDGSCWISRSDASKSIDFDK